MPSDTFAVEQIFRNFGLSEHLKDRKEDFASENFAIAMLESCAHRLILLAREEDENLPKVLTDLDKKYQTIVLEHTFSKEPEMMAGDDKPLDADGEV